MKNILVVGDAMIDHYVFGNVSRLNPEAPHTVILDTKSEKRVLGGATNVAVNLASVLPDDYKVYYLGYTDDEVIDYLTTAGVATTDKFPAEILVKKRFISNNHHILRVDEGVNYSKYEDGVSIVNFAKEKSKKIKWDLIVVSDYKKLTISSHMIKELVKIAEEHNTIVLADLKMNYLISLYWKNIIVKCNEAERFHVQLPIGGRSAIPATFTTKGSQGVEVLMADDPNFQIRRLVPAKNKRDVVDVVGAGDAFLVGMAVSYLKNGLDFISMAEYGNEYAEAKIGHFGTYVLKKEDINDDYKI